LTYAKTPGRVFFNDCGLETARNAAGLLRSQVTQNLLSKPSQPGWSYIPSLYIVCELDRAISAATQHDCARRLRAQNRSVTIVGIAAGHSPFVSRARETAAFVVQASEEQ